jgi:hypothetical protein
MSTKHLVLSQLINDLDDGANETPVSETLARIAHVILTTDWTFDDIEPVLAANHLAHEINVALCEYAQLNQASLMSAIQTPGAQSLNAYKITLIFAHMLDSQNLISALAFVSPLKRLFGLIPTSGSEQTTSLHHIVDCLRFLRRSRAPIPDAVVDAYGEIIAAAGARSLTTDERKIVRLMRDISVDSGVDSEMEQKAQLEQIWQQGQALRDTADAQRTRLANISQRERGRNPHTARMLALADNAVSEASTFLRQRHDSAADAERALQRLKQTTLKINPKANL